uniref:Uncharacterized protein n=1 Tax=Pyxicephalus adspersus TaxID=30357 RepID=A0AAV3AVR8_PYXAD|nr:TPA: hypothetical protein GDO54_000803 [Pyxicephalus adspersus]
MRFFLGGGEGGQRYWLLRCDLQFTRAPPGYVVSMRAMQHFLIFRVFMFLWFLYCTSHLFTLHSCLRATFCSTRAARVEGPPSVILVLLEQPPHQAPQVNTPSTSHGYYAVGSTAGILVLAMGLLPVLEFFTGVLVYSQ